MSTIERFTSFLSAASEEVIIASVSEWR